MRWKGVSEVTLGRPGSEARSGRPLPLPLRHACETASATVKMGRKRCRLAGSGFPAGFALTGIERDRASSRCAAAFLIVETQFCLRTHYLPFMPGLGFVLIPRLRERAPRPCRTLLCSSGAGGVLGRCWPSTPCVRGSPDSRWYYSRRSRRKGGGR